jgi:hypothetical protein
MYVCRCPNCRRFALYYLDARGLAQLELADPNGPPQLAAPIRLDQTETQPKFDIATRRASHGARSHVLGMQVDCGSVTPDEA